MTAWNSKKQARWNELCEKRFSDSLTEKEQQEWDLLAQALDADEFVTLKPVIERMESDNLALEQALQTAEKEKQRLTTLLDKRRKENARLQARLGALQQEYKTLKKSLSKRIPQTSNK
ncbi:MAG: hypothetical protein KIT45_02790 [Fimbriimonadia bacterium]|nr:hypothetical protein [Fimbriimonadia bacterium]